MPMDSRTAAQRPFDLPVPVALAKLVDGLDALPHMDRPVFEPKWDGYRALTAGGRLYSRRGTDLTRYFPDLAPVLSARLPADVVLDGEIVAWDTAAGRLDFASLQARLTAGNRIASVSARRPAQFVAFDILAADGHDLRGQSLDKRRRVLEKVMSGVASPIALCQQTTDPLLAREWFDTLIAGGIEGLVIKDAAGTYPTKEGQRPWWKVKAKSALDMVAIGYTGPVSSPTTLVLAFRGRVDDVGVPVTAGSTTTLTKALARSVSPLLAPTGQSFERVFAWGPKEPSTVHVIEPLVVEVSADASVQSGALRHAAKLLRARPDLAVEDLDQGA